MNALHAELQAALRIAFEKAIADVGLSTFMKTSLFGSNERAVEFRKAA